MGPTLYAGWFGSKSLMYPNVLSYGKHASSLMETLGSWIVYSVLENTSLVLHLPSYRNFVILPWPAVATSSFILRPTVTCLSPLHALPSCIIGLSLLWVRLPGIASNWICVSYQGLIPWLLRIFKNRSFRWCLCQERRRVGRRYLEGGLNQVLID